MKTYVIAFPGSDQPKSFIRFTAADDESASALARSLTGGAEGAVLWQDDRQVVASQPMASRQSGIG